MLTTTRNVSIAKMKIILAKRAAFAAKIARNCSKTLGRIDKLVQLAPNFDRPSKANLVRLVYVGTNPAADLVRLERVLGKFDTNNCVKVEMGRIEVVVKIKNLPVVAVPLRQAA